MIDCIYRQNLFRITLNFLEKCGELSEWVVFGQNLRYFTDQKGPKGGPDENEF